MRRIRVSFCPDSETICLASIAPATPTVGTPDAGPRRMPEGPGTPKSGRGSCSLEDSDAPPAKQPKAEKKDDAGRKTRKHGMLFCDNIPSHDTRRQRSRATCASASRWASARGRSG